MTGTKCIIVYFVQHIYSEAYNLLAGIIELKILREALLIRFVFFI